MNKPHMPSVTSESSSAIRTTLGLLPVLAISAVAGNPAFAQDGGGEVLLDEVTVAATGQPVNTNNVTPGVGGRIPTTIQDTPQVINVITSQQIQQRAITNLSELITRVPGVTMSAGEGGGGGMGGDSFNIRGQSAIGNIFVDGVRDAGIASRDPFNSESIEVFKGGAGVTLGRGGGGGSINMTTKAPRVRDFTELLVTAGNAEYGRVALDMNRVVNDNVAVRFNAVALSRGFAGRDHINQKRWAIAPSITFGMNSDTKLTISALHQRDWGRPDTGFPRFGIPVANGGDGINRPTPSLGVPSSNYYGFLENFEEYETTTLTAKFEHRFSDNLQFTNALRLGDYWHDRWDSTMTPGSIFNAATCPTGIEVTCTFTPGESTRGMSGRTIHNQATLTGDFVTGGVKHDFMLGFDVSREDLVHYNNTVAGPAIPALNLMNPVLASNGRTRTLVPRFDHKVTTIGVTAYDRADFGNGFFAVGNLRVERFKVDSFDRTTLGTSNYADTLVSWLGALEYKPAENTTYYLSFSNTMTPRSPTTGYTGLINVTSVKPQQSRTVELGAKWNLFNDRLGLGASAFVTKLTDEITADPVTGVITVTAGTQRIKGLELTAAGQVTDKLVVSAGYAWSKGTLLNGASAGNRVGLLPEHSGYIWADYKVNDVFSVGGGVNFSSHRFTANYNPANLVGAGRLPGHVTVDLSANYQVNERFAVQFNAINIFDQHNYQKSHGARGMVLGQGRTFLLTGKMTF